MGRSRQPQGRDRIRNRARKVYNVGNTSLTGFAVVLFFAFGGLICAFAPQYLELSPGTFFANVWIAMAVIFGLIGLGGLVLEVSEVWGSFRANSDAWVSASITVFFVLLVVAVHLFAIVALRLTGPLEIGAKLLAISLCFPLALALAATIDDFFISPRLQPEHSQTTRRQREARNRLIGNMGAVILWFLTVVSTILALLDRLAG